MSRKNNLLQCTSGISGTVLILIAVITGCVGTSTPYNPPELYIVNVNRIEQHLEDGEIVQAMEDLLRLRADNESGVRESEIDSLEERIRQELKEAVLLSIEESKYTDAIRRFISAETAGWDLMFDELTLNDLKKERILDLVDSDQSVQALAYLRQLDDLDILSDDELLQLLNVAIDEKKYTVVSRIVDVLVSRDVVIETELPPDAAYHYSHTELIKGTVTIWVNRGMRIEEGVGLPDRVIGSGFYVDKRGYIITNYHVIRSQVDPEYEGYSRLYIRPSENPDLKIPARVIGWDTVFDIALLKVEKETESVFSFSQVEKQSPGARIYAIGSPAGLENTITSGIVSATDRRFLQMGNVIQVDVPINQGNSGGPLLDEDGNLIGVVFAGIEQFEGVNFAIPVRWLNLIFPELYGEAKVTHPFLGVTLQKVEGDMEVSYVLPGSAADRIGIEPGDILLSIDGREFKDMTEAQDAILHYQAGTLVNVGWKDKNGVIREFPAALDVRPDIPLEKAIQYDRPEKLFAPAFGMQVEKIQDNLMGTRYVVTKIYQGGIADDTGMSINDPFSLQQWKFLQKEQVLLAQVRIQKRKAGFLETGVQLGTYTETNNFL